MKIIYNPTAKHNLQSTEQCMYRYKYAHMHTHAKKLIYYNSNNICVHRRNILHFDTIIEINRKKVDFTRYLYAPSRIKVLQTIRRIIFINL